MIVHVYTDAKNDTTPEWDDQYCRAQYSNTCSLARNIEKEKAAPQLAQALFSW